MFGDGGAIYTALLAHATASASLASPTAAPIGDATSERIYSALLGAAAASSAAAAPVAFERVQLVASTTPTETAGFVSTRLQDLTSPVPILIGVLVLLLGLFVASAGARSLLWASHWGKPRGTFEGRAHIPGGIGGIVFGGIVSSTIAILFTLLIVSRETAPALGSWGTLAVLVTTALPGAFVGSRFRFAARACVGLLGAFSITLLLTATFKLGTLLPRLIILAIAATLAVVLCLVPQTQRSVSIFSALSAAYLFVLGIDLLVHSSFVDLLGLLVAQNGVGVDGAASEIVVHWTTSIAKGLLAAWWIVAVVSFGWQWYWAGAGSGDVDESWNAYLSSFVSSQPAALGSFTPEPSFFARLFRRGSPAPLTSLPTRRQSPWDDDDEKPSDDWDDDADTLAGRSDPPVKYGKTSWADDEQADDAFLPYERPAREMDAVSRLSGSTVWGDGPEKKAMLGEDEDEDLPTSAATASAEQPKVKQLLSIFGRSKSPARYSGRITPTTTLSFPPAARSASPTSNRPLSPLSPAATRPMSPLSNPSLSPRSVPANAVPATPSLINALQRVNAAQKQARGEVIPEEREVDEPRQRQPSWDDWWKEVVDKADKK